MFVHGTLLPVIVLPINGWQLGVELPLAALSAAMAIRAAASDALLDWLKLTRISLMLSLPGRREAPAKTTMWQNGKSA